LAADGAPSLVRVGELPAAGSGIAIAGDEAHYLARVVRLRAGERFGATDGRGTLATLELLAAGATCRARVLERTQVPRARPLEIWCGAPEGARADWLVEKLGELGVAALVPIDCERATWGRAAGRRERWERLTLAALRQSRSAWALELRPPARLVEAVRALPVGGARLACRPEGHGWAGIPAVPADPPAVAVVGPSSGFSDAELKLLDDNGFVALSLAGGRLRTETAALAVAALWAGAMAGPAARDGVA